MKIENKPEIGHDNMSMEDLKNIGYEIFSREIESIEINGNMNNNEKYEYYTLYRYLSLIDKYGELIDNPPIDNITIDVKFRDIPYTFVVQVEIGFIGPEKFNHNLVGKIDNTLNIDLCNIKYGIYEITKVYDKLGDKKKYLLFPEQRKEELEFKKHTKDDIRELKGLLGFKQKIIKKIKSDKNISNSIAKRYNEVLRSIENGGLIDEKLYKKNILNIYKDEGYINKLINNSKGILENEKEKKYCNKEDLDDNSSMAESLKKDELILENAYKEQGAQLYNNMLKGGEYNDIYNEEINILENNREKLKKYVGAFHVGLGCGDMSKELELYKQILGIKYLDSNINNGLDPDSEDISMFRNTHAFLGVDVSSTYKNNLHYFNMLGFGIGINNYEKYFFDDKNLDFSSDSFFDLFTGDPKKFKENINIKPEKMETKSFSMLGNTLLNFSNKNKIKLLDNIVDTLGNNTIGLIGIHKSNNFKELNRLYNTKQMKEWFDNLLQANYGVDSNNYKLLVDSDKDGNIILNIKLTKKTKFYLGENNYILKGKGKILHITNSEKYTKKIFHDIISKTKNVEIIDILEGEGLVDIYVLGNKRNKKIKEGFEEFSIDFNENYLKSVKKYKNTYRDIINKAEILESWKEVNGEFISYYCFIKLGDRLIKGEYCYNTELDGEEFFLPKYIDFKLMNSKSGKDVPYRLTLRKGNNGYSFFVDDDGDIENLDMDEDIIKKSLLIGLKLMMKEKKEKK